MNRNGSRFRPGWLLGVLAVVLTVLGLAGCGINELPAQARTSAPSSAQSAEAAQPKPTRTRIQPTRTPQRTRVAKTPTVRPPAKTPTPEADDPFIIRDVRIYDLNGRLAYRGDVDLNPTLDRIDRGIRDPHRNDGAVFGNFEGRLPRKPRGYYHEYVLRTPGISGVGPQRVIIGEDSEIYYTPDHYETFIRVQ